MFNERQKLGRFGEMLACEYLIRRGYKIIDKNYRTRGGEVDIVAKKDETIVFVEVKTRKNGNFGAPEEAIDEHKQLKICQTVECYLQSNNILDKEFRLDSIAIVLDVGGKKAKLRHKKDIYIDNY